MVIVFKVPPERVRFEFTPATEDTPCQLTIHHADGSFVESFRTTAMGVKRMRELEEVIAHLSENPTAA